MRKQQGMVLPLTLLILAILLIMSSLMIQRSDSQLNRLHVDRKLWQAQLKFHSAEQRVQFAMLVGEQEPGGYRLAGTFIPIDNEPLLLSNDVTIKVQDQAGLLSLFYINKTLLLGLLNSYYSADQATDIANAIIDWQNIDADIPYGRGGPMRSLDELMLIPGITPEIYNGTASRPGLKHWLTLSGSSWINFGAISPALMARIYSAGELEINAFIEARKRGRWRRVQEILFDWNLGGTGQSFTPSSRYMIEYEYQGIRARGDYQIRASAGTPARRRAWYFPDVTRTFRMPE